MRIFILFAGTMLPSMLAAQAPQKGRIELLWGWNRDTYSNSDIRFRGNGYDFTLHDVRATDRPTPVSVEYLNPVKLTIPQTNLRINYAFAEHWAAGIAFDHMKYVMVQDQQVRMTGSLPPEAGPPVADGDGRVTLSREFLTYEHTDGLNFVNARLERRDRLASVRVLRMELSSALGASVGALVPRTACRFNGNMLSDDYHLSGAGAGLSTAVRITFLERLVLSAEGHGGRIWMPDVRTTNDPSDRASQAFWFAEAVVMFGASFPLVRQPGANQTEP